MPSTEPEMSDAEWKRQMGIPKFMSPNEAQVLAIETDPTGQNWAFLKVADNWMYLPYAARYQTVDGHSLDLAIRLFWSDEDPPSVDDDELLVIGATILGRTSGFRPTWLENHRASIYAVRLPFRANEVNIVDTHKN